MIHDGIRMLRLSVRPQALNEDKIKEVKEICDLYGVPVEEVCVNGIKFKDGYIQYSEMAEILELLQL